MTASRTRSSKFKSAVAADYIGADGSRVFNYNLTVEGAGRFMSCAFVQLRNGRPTRVAPGRDCPLNPTKLIRLARLNMVHSTPIDYRKLPRSAAPEIN